MRKSEIARKTGETEITLQLNLDGTGQYQIQTGVGLFGPHADRVRPPWFL